MKKVRVFELAKDFGMKGPDLAKLLKTLGFENVKTHMTVLDDGDLMMIEARLAAQGLRKQAAGVEAPGGPPRKKLLPKGAASDVETAPEPETLHPARKELKELQPKKSLPKAPPPPPKKAIPKKHGESEVEPQEDLEPRHETAAEASPVLAPAEEKRHAEPEPRRVAKAPLPIAEPAPPRTDQPDRTDRTDRADRADRTQRRAPEPERHAARPAAAAPQPAAAPIPPAPPLPAEERRQPAAAAAAAPAEAPTAPLAPQAPDDVKRLLVPQKKATVVGRIELPQETIRDATRRSAPAAPRDLRRAALQKTQSRTATRSSMPSSHRRGPGGPMSRGGPGGRDGGRRGMGKSKIQSTVDPNKVIEVEEPVSIKALSEALGTKVNELVATLTFKLGVPGKNINSFLSKDEVELVALELGRQVKVVEHKEVEDQMLAQLVEEAEGEEQILRAPVVTFMGHVDHGKTSLMDALRHSDVAKGEAGGITQHIGAYKVTTESGQEFVILDTPGHAAFTAMRARGSELTDLVVLVVAGDDGVKPQTEEAINHAKAAEVPVIVAITKCDLPSAKPDQVKQQLALLGLQPEEWGGTTGMIEVSAVTGKGLDALVERIALDSELLELRARPDAPGKGIVVESKQSPEQGVVVTVLITDGTLRLKDSIVCGESFSRVRAMIDDHGNSLEEAGPSTPVTVFGLDRLPTPGDSLFVVENAKKAREVVEVRQRKIRELSLADRAAVTLDTLSAKLNEKNIQEIKLILKADAMGSLEPLRKCLEELATGEVRVNLVHSGLGGINETDVSLAQTSGSVIVGFNTVADTSARQAAEQAGVEIRYYDVIYELLDQVRAAMEGLLKPQEVESIVGHAEVRAVFKSSKFGLIAGCYVTDGIARRSAKVRLTRDGKVVWTGKIASLRRLQDDVRDVRAGFECGMTLQDYQDVKVGDILEFAQIDLVKRTLG